MKRLLANLAIAGISVIAALLIVEGVYRLAKGRTAAARSDRPLFYYMPEGSAALNDAPYPDRPAAGTFRMAVVGDSFAFAPHMQFDDAFPKRLERMLNMNRDAGTVEVLNMGVPGVSTVHEARAVEKAFRRGARLVLLQVTLNDLQEKPFSRRELEWAERFGPLRLKGAMKRLTRYWQSLGYVLKRLHNMSTRPAYVAYYHDLLRNPANRLQVEKGLERIAASSREHGGQLAAVIFPLFGTPLGAAYPFRAHHEYFAAQLAARGIPVLDLLETFTGIPQERLLVMPGKDLHPGEIAHRLAAEKIYLWLAERNSIPSQFLIRRRLKRRTALNPAKRRAHEERGD